MDILLLETTDKTHFHRTRLRKGIKGEQRHTSEYEFWNFLFRLLGVSGVEIRYASGKDNMPDLMEEIYKECRDLYDGPTKEKSRVFVCYDTTLTADDFENLNRRFGEKQKQFTGNFVKFDFPRFYCYEDCLLLFPELLRWVYSEERLVSKVQLQLYFNEYKKFGLSNKADIWKSSREINDFIKSSDYLHEKYEPSREQIAGELVEYLTKGTYFLINKDTLGDCWLNDCKNSCFLEKTSAEYLEKHKCGIYKQKLAAKDQAVEILNRSEVLKYLYNDTWIFDSIK